MNTKLLLSLAAMALIVSSARADERFFTYIYETETLPQGKWEFEQWLTLRQGHPKGDRNFNQSIWDFREEIEYGLTDKLSISGYLNFRADQYVARNEDVQDSSEFLFKGVSAEFKYQLLSPNTDPVGLSLYFEPTYNSNEQELEYKVLLSKNIGDSWVLAANASFEQEWKHEEGTTGKESVFELSSGVAYRITPHWSIGLEARYHSVFEGLMLNEDIGAGLFIGPNVHYGRANWWGTFSVAPQITGSPSDGGINRTEHQTVEAKLIVGVNF